VARFLIMNNEAEERAVGEIQQIYASVERNIYYFLGAVVTAICITSFYMIHQNRRLFESVAQLSEQRQVLARQLISMQEDIFRSIARELHDEFGQVMTAVGAMLRRLEKRAAGDDSLRPGFEEIRAAIQHTLDSVRSLSLRLHPNLLDDYGLENALEWYVKQFQEQTGLDIRYEKEGSGSPVDSEIAIHVYRILQEALNNVVRHAQSSVAWVRMRRRPDHLQLEIEDRGVGLPNGTQRTSGLGLVAMRERSELVHGSLEFLRPAEGGTLIRLEVPLAAQRVSS
jgi:signal transduction histidine kinase